MKFYFAPLEGVTGYIYRNTYNKFFGEEMDKYTNNELLFYLKRIK